MTENTSVRVCGMEAEKGRWLLVVIGMVINLCIGSIYAWSVFVAPLTKYFTDKGLTVTAADVMWPFSVFLAFFAIAMPLTGKYIEKFGPKKVSIVGGILTGLGWLLASLSPNVLLLYVFYGLIGGIGVGITYGCPIAVSTRWFPDRRGLAVGLTVLGFGFSAFITANLAGALINTMDVMSTFRIFGIAFIILIILLALPLRFPPPGWKPKGWNPANSKNANCTVECQRHEMLKKPAFYGLWVCFFIGCLAGLMAIGIAKPVGTEAIKLDSGIATMLVGVFAIFNGGGRPVFGALTDKLTPRITSLISFVLIAVASLLMWFFAAPGPAGIAVYIISFAILWACLGGWLAIAPTTTASYFGTSDYPNCYGLVFLAYGAGAIAGPQLAAALKDMGGNYISVFPYVVGLAVVGFILTLVLLKPPKK